MPTSRSRALRYASILLLLALAAGCNAVLGIDEAMLDENVGRSDAAPGDDQCLLNSHCEVGEVCIFRSCSPPCESERDCDGMRHCLVTEEGSGCVDAREHGCEGDDDCPTPTVCREGQCQAECDPREPDDCLEGQTCTEEVCVTDRGDAGASGSPDAAMDGGGAAEDGGVEDGGEPAPECEPDLVRCDNGVRQSCVNGDWQELEVCPSFCTPDACVDECGEGEAFCSGETLLTCDADGEPVEEVCPYVCGGDACVGECRPMARECVDQASYRVCGEDGFWQEDVECSDQACAPDSGSCIGECSPGNTRCGDGEEVETCNATGNWETTETCEDQACVSAQCVGVCGPGDLRCASTGPAYQECQSDGTWGASVSCGGAACVSGQCTGSCTPDDTRCEPGSGVDVQRCSDEGVWEADETCAGQACVDGACEGVCEPSELRCVDDSSYHVCQSDGTFDADTDCVNQACVDDACTGVCSPGSTLCSGDSAVQVCTSAGAWGSADPCSDQACVDGACMGQCGPSSRRCDGQRAQLCSSTGAWNTTDTCEGPDEICRSGACEANEPYLIGNDDVSGASWEEYDAPANFIFAVPIDIAVGVTLLQVNLRGHAAGGLARLAIYEDDGGEPGDRIALASSNFSVIDGPNGSSVNPTGLELAGGATYWVAALFSASAPIHRNLDAANPDGRLLAGSFPTLPDPWNTGGATVLTDVALSISLTVQDVTP